MASTNNEASQPVNASTLHAFAPGYQPEHARISALDILKGIAVMAGLMITILYWGGFSTGMQQALTDFPGGVRYKT